MIANLNPAPPVSFSEDGGSIDVHDPRLFRPGHEAFCRRLADAAAAQPGVRSARVSLGSGSCRIDFEPKGLDQAEIAGRFEKAVHSAIEGETEARSASNGASDRDWTSIASFARDGDRSIWETTRESFGSIRLRNSALVNDRGLATRVAKDLANVPGIESCRVTFWSRELDIRFDPHRLTPDAALFAADDALRKALRPASELARGQDEEAPEVARGFRRLWYLTLASGSFGLTLVGLIVPGIPTVPFLLATSYYLARSSPTLKRILLRSRFFGPILSELENEGGLRLISKIKLIGFTLVLTMATLILAGPALVLLLPMAAAILVSVYAISRIPGIPSRARGGHRPALALA